MDVTKIGFDLFVFWMIQLWFMPYYIIEDSSV